MKKMFLLVCLLCLVGIPVQASENGIKRPTMVQNFEVKNITSQSVELVWEPVNGATSYKIYLNNKKSKLVYSGKKPQFTHKNLKPETDYEYYIYSNNSKGMSYDYNYAWAYTKDSTPTPEPTPEPIDTTPTPTPVTKLWSPPAGYNTQWQWQLSSKPTYINGVNIYGFDGDAATAADVKSFKDKGAKSICYISAGSYEDWRKDASTFPASVKGKGLDGWEGEQWLDVRQLEKLLPIMGKRMDSCKAKGFDAVEPDNIDGYTNDTGFPLKSSDQLAYNKALSKLAHDRGLSIALKNDGDQAKELEPYFDFVINEQCYQYNECDNYQPFLDTGKAVLNVEYKETSNRCSKAKSAGISSMRKNLNLDAWREPCT